MSHPPLRVAIVGGGISGLGAAYALEQRSQAVEVTLLEAGARLGGKVQTDRIGNVLVERGPDALFVRSPLVLEALNQLGLGGDVVRADPLQRETTILRGGQFHRLPEGMETGVPRAMWPTISTGLLSPAGKARAATEMLVPRRDVDGDESVDAFVRRRFGGEVAERIAAPLLGGIYSSDTRELSLLATVPHLRNWEHEHRSLLLATVRGRLPGTRRNPDTPSPFISLRRGLESLVSALQDGCRRTQIRLGTNVIGLLPGRGGSGFSLEIATGERLEADRVIVTTPAFVMADLVQRLSPAAAEKLRATRYASATIVALTFTPDAAVRVPRGSGFLVAPGEPSLIKACSWSSQKWPHCASTGEVVVRCHLRSEIGPADDATLIQSVRAELRELIGLHATPCQARVYRWPRSIPSYSVGHLDRVRAIEAALSEFPDLVLAGAGLRGVGVPECLRQGMSAADQVLELDFEKLPERV